MLGKGGMTMEMRDRLIDILVKHWFDGMTMGECADMLLANGVIVPPCKVGDTIYFLSKYVKDWLYDEVEYIRVYKDYMEIKTVADRYFEEEDFGKTVFLTKEEAEKALKEREGNG